MWIAATAAAALAADPPAERSTQTLAAWWARPGSPGWTPDAAFTYGHPSVFAGLVAGAFSLRDPLALSEQPWPGVAEAQAPLAWYDSAAVVVGEHAAWRGFRGALADGELALAMPTGRKPRSVWTAVNGSNSIERNGIYVARGDAGSWLRAGAVAGQRGGLGALDLAGDHLWVAESGIRRGGHTLAASFAQRGMGERQRVGFSEGARGESGRARWSWTDGARSFGAELARGHDARRSSGVLVADVPGSRREAQENALALEAAVRRDSVTWGVRGELRRDRAARRASSTGFARDWADDSWWLAAKHARPFGPGRLELELGGGHATSPGRAAERWQLAPGAAWRLARGAWRARAFAERVVTPVWSDLAPGTPAFVQDTWLGGLEAGAASGRRRAALLLTGGTSGNRGVLLRYPVRDVALRLDYLGTGWNRDLTRYAFALGQAEAGATWRALGAEASGWVLARDGDRVQGRVDPSVGATVALSTAFRLFTGDLGVRLRAETAWIGPRVTDASDASLVEDVTLNGYATSSAVAEMTLGDATLVVRADGLENERHPLGWIDPAGDGFALARGSGRTFRFEMIWPLFN